MYTSQILADQFPVPHWPVLKLSPSTVTRFSLASFNIVTDQLSSDHQIQFPPRPWTSSSQVFTRYCSQVTPRYNSQLLANQMPGYYQRKFPGPDGPIPKWSSHTLTLTLTLTLTSNLQIEFSSPHHDITKLSTQFLCGDCSIISIFQYH